MSTNKKDSATRGSDRSRAVELKEAAIGDLPAGFVRPSYNRRDVRPAIVHFGVGGFHRAHQAVYTDDVLGSGDLAWGIRGAGITEADARMKEALSAQDYLYSVVARDNQGEDRRVVGSILDLMVASADPSQLVGAMADESTRIISMTITENGYCYRPESGELDFDLPGIRNDVAQAGQLRTIYGCLHAAFTRIRRERRRPPTVLSCDNLPQNGDRLRRLFLQFLERVDADLAKFVADEVAFPNCMVDRITPMTTAEQQKSFAESFGVVDRRPVFCERFRQWVIEDHFPAGRPDWSLSGATFVPDVVPFERMKIRLLNGSHSALGYVSYLLGFRRVDLAMSDPDVRLFLRAYMNEVSPTVGAVPGVDLEGYKDSLIERFSNPAIADQVLRLAQDGSKKIPNMILEPIGEILDDGRSCPRASFALAAWIRFLEGTDEAGEPIPIDDPQGPALQAAARQTRAGGVSQFLGIGSVFPESISRSETLRRAVSESLSAIRSKGMRSALRSFVSAPTGEV
ncbi:MAG TPA: mannitol dehydrogenase family protein [Spirochaetia bacterium]|nr:mannitol dehydrogenase family protein [Spirochaetia bacterium]